MNTLALQVVKPANRIFNKYTLAALAAAVMSASAKAVDSEFVTGVKTKITTLETDTSSVAIAAIAIVAVIALFYLIKGFFYAK